MGRIAKKQPVVKKQKEKKKLLEPLFTIRKDSLGRRYAVEKRTGKRVPVIKAEKERQKRKKTKAKKLTIFRGINTTKKTKKKTKAPKAPKSKKKTSKRSKPPVSKKSIIKKVRKRPTKATRPKQPKKKPSPQRKRQPPLAASIAASPFALKPTIKPELIPSGMQLHLIGGIADRGEIFPKVKIANEESWLVLQTEAMQRRLSVIRGEKPPVFVHKMDRLYGPGTAEFIRYEIFTRAHNIADIDELVQQLLDDAEYDFSARELYTLYFSPEVA
jgi:hypothetical protein